MNKLEDGGSKKLSSLKRMEFLEKIFSPHEGVSESQICDNFGITPQLGNYIKKTHPLDLIVDNKIRHRIKEFREEVKAKKLAKITAQEVRVYRLQVVTTWIIPSVSLAAVVLMAVIWLFFSFNPTPAPAGEMEMERMQKALKKAVWVHIDYQTGKLAGGGDWRRFNPQVVAAIRLDGSAFYVNEAQGVGQSYVDGKIIDKTDWRIHIRKEKSVYEFIDNKCEQRLSQAIDYTIQKAVLGGKTSLLFVIEAGKNDLKIWCDPVTYLPQKIHSINLNFLLSFPAGGPESIHDLIQPVQP